MISVAQGVEYRKSGIIFFTGSEEIPCPVCGGQLRVHGTCRRKLQTKEGVDVYRLRVMECKACGKTHRELPEGIVPYKRMDAKLLGSIAEDPGAGELEAPDISTWDRVKAWVKRFLAYARHILEEQRIAYGKAFATIPAGHSLSRQLAYYVRLVVNSGNWNSIVRWREVWFGRL